MAWAPDYVTAAQLKSYLRITDVDDDAEIGFAITAASRAVDAFTNRQFGSSTAAARFYTAVWDSKRRRHVVEIDDVQDDTGLAVSVDDDDDGTYDVTVTDFRLFPLNAEANGRPFVLLVLDGDADPDLPLTEGAVKVTALWGWTAVPTAVKQATLIQASRFFLRRNAPFGIAGSPETGSEMRLLAKVDPDVATALSPYRRHWVVQS